MHAYVFFHKSSTELKPIQGHFDFAFGGYDINVVCPCCSKVIDYDSIYGNHKCIIYCDDCRIHFYLCAGIYKKIFDINYNKCIENVTDENTLAELENTIRKNNYYEDINIKEYNVRKAELTYITKLVIDEISKYEFIDEDDDDDDYDYSSDIYKYIDKECYIHKMYYDINFDLPEDYKEYENEYYVDADKVYEYINIYIHNDNYYLTDKGYMNLSLCDGGYMKFVSYCDKCKEKCNNFITLK